MTIDSALQISIGGKILMACIFDGDGVLLASPHEQACSETLLGFAEPTEFGSEFCVAFVADKSGLAGARTALSALHVPIAASGAAVYEDHKQERLLELINPGAVEAYPDALRLIQSLHAIGWPRAAASSSKIAKDLLQAICLDRGDHCLICLRPMFAGRIPRETSQIQRSRCLLVEDAAAGFMAARAIAMPPCCAQLIWIS